MFQVAVALSHGSLSVPCSVGAPGVGGECYSTFYPLQPLLAAPIVWLANLGAGAFGASGEGVAASAVHLVPVCAAAGSALLARRIALEWGASPRAAWIAPLALLLGTQMIMYSRSFFAESLAAFFATLMIWALQRRDTRNLWVMLGATGLVLAKPQLVFLAIALIFAGGLGSRRTLAWGCAGIAVATLLHGLHNEVRWGSVTQFGTDRELHKAAMAPDRLLDALTLLVASPGRGLLFFSPVVALGLVVGLVRIPHARGRWLLIAVTIAALGMAAMNPGGGVNWGSRYLLPLIPAACAAVALAGGVLRPVIATLVGWSFLLQLPVLFVAAESAYRVPISAGALPKEIYWSWTNGPAVEAWKVLADSFSDPALLLVWWREVPGSLRPVAILVSVGLCLLSAWLARGAYRRAAREPGHADQIEAAEGAALSPPPGAVSHVR